MGGGRRMPSTVSMLKPMHLRVAIGQHEDLMFLAQFPSDQALFKIKSPGDVCGEP